MEILVVDDEIKFGKRLRLFRERHYQLSRPSEPHARAHQEQFVKVSSRSGARVVVTRGDPACSRVTG